MVRRVRTDPLTRLALDAGGGDADALDALVEGSYAAVRRLCAGLVDQQAADDLAQETFVRAVRALPSFTGASSALTWLLAVARHTCLDELRSRRRRRDRDEALTVLAASGRPTGGSGGADASLRLIAEELLGLLDPDRRAAFVLTQLLGLSYDDAASVCECPVGTIRSRVARARADLVDLLASGESGDARRPAVSPGRSGAAPASHERWRPATPRRAGRT